MSRVLSGRIRKMGNSLAVIIPKGLLDEAGAKEGDTVRLSLAIPTSRRDSALEAAAGVDREDGLFEERNGTDIEPSRLSRNQSEVHWTVWETIIVLHVSFSTDHLGWG